MDVADANRSRFGAVAFPQLKPAGAVVRRKVEGVVDLGPQINRIYAETAANSRPDIFDSIGAGCGSVAAPKFKAAEFVIGDEIERSSDIDQILRRGTERSGNDVFDANGP